VVAGDIEEPAARFQEPGGGFQHGLLPGRERGQVAFPEAALDLRVTPNYAQGGTRNVQDHRVQGGGFQRESLGGVSPERVGRRHAQRRVLSCSSLRRLWWLSTATSSPELPMASAKWVVFASPAGADLRQAQVQPQRKQAGSQLSPSSWKIQRPSRLRGQVRGGGLKGLKYEAHRGKPAGPGLHPF